MISYLIVLKIPNLILDGMLVLKWLWREWINPNEVLWCGLCTYMHGQRSTVLGAVLKNQYLKLMTLECTITLSAILIFFVAGRDRLFLQSSKSAF